MYQSKDTKATYESHRKTQKKRDDYLNALFGPETKAQQISRKSALDLGVSHMSLHPYEARILRWMVQRSGGRKFVEIGTLTGLSALHLAEGLPRGAKLWTLELKQEHATKAREAMAEFEKAQPGKLVFEVLEGSAETSLDQLVSEGPFDGVFIDANKSAYLTYLNWTLANLKTGGLCIIDNCFLFDAVFDQEVDPPLPAKQVRVMQDVNQIMADPKFFDSICIPTDQGMMIGIRTENPGEKRLGSPRPQED